jgi:hypothetical protein
VKKSKGHVAFVGNSEWYLRDDHMVKAPIGNAFDPEGHRMGRVEAWPHNLKPGWVLLANAIKHAKRAGKKVSVERKHQKEVREAQKELGEGIAMDRLGILLEELRTGSDLSEIQTTLFKPHELGMKDITAGKRVFRSALKLVAKNPGLDKFKRQGDSAYSGYAKDAVVMKGITDRWMEWGKKNKMKYSKGQGLIAQKLVFFKPGTTQASYPVVELSARETGKGIYVNIVVWEPGTVARR